MVNDRIGFSLWLDFIERDYIKGDFKELVAQGVINGATSNPAIFSSSIKKSAAYISQLRSLKNHSPKAKYEALAKEDIKLAAEALYPLYEKGKDGFVSIEVDPFLCDDKDATIEEGYRLYKEIGMPNVMIKIPATQAGYEAMRELIKEGININATLIFSPLQALKCLDALKDGLSLHGRSNKSGTVSAVLSVFVSRFDRALDEKLKSAGLQPGRVGILNAARIYNLVESANEKSIRTLFASTGVKGGAYEEDYYIKELMAPHSVNTAPLITIEAFLEHPLHAPKLPIDEEAIVNFFSRVEEAGVDMQQVYDGLVKDGLDSFKEAFSNLLSHLE